MKYARIIIGLLIVLIILVTIDLTTGIWFWNKKNLMLEPSNFNNILTPIISFCAFIVYSLALITTIRQNKIILSQNIKPFFEKQIDEYLMNYDLSDELAEELLEYIKTL